MAEIEPVLELVDARAADGPAAAAPKLSLRLLPGELALVHVREAADSARLADLCCGVAPLAEGSVRFLGRDWSDLPRDYADALRGLIGRVFAAGGWVEFIDVATNILLPQLHHTRIERGALRQAATTLAAAFGLPGLPIGPVAGMTVGDRVRAAFVRAFLGEPALVLLERPLQDRYADYLPALVDALEVVRSRGGAALWLTGGDQAWSDRTFPADHRLRLSERGLIATRRAA
jgi:phospholipid/cholesterol/gamma-HCH transport system ATP-binding protein